MADKKNNRRNNKDYDDDYRIKKIGKLIYPKTDNQKNKKKSLSFMF